MILAVAMMFVNLHGIISFGIAFIVLPGRYGL